MKILLSIFFSFYERPSHYWKQYRSSPSSHPTIWKRAILYKKELFSRLFNIILYYILSREIWLELSEFYVMVHYNIKK